MHRDVARTVPPATLSGGCAFNAPPWNEQGTAWTLNALSGAVSHYEANSMIGRKHLIAATAALLGFASAGAFAGGDAVKSEQPISDTVITTKVKAELAKDKATKATDINVETKNGIVSLNGAVKSEAERAKAELDARTVKGVVDVTNNLRVAAK
jgi:hyperosmotically inducible protein